MEERIIKRFKTGVVNNFVAFLVCVYVCVWGGGAGGLQLCMEVQ